jgi:hypothetical protein
VATRNSLCTCVGQNQTEQERDNNDGRSGIERDVGGERAGTGGGEGRGVYACASAREVGRTGQGRPSRGISKLGIVHGGVGREWGVGEDWDGVVGMREGGDQPVGLEASMVGGPGVHNPGPWI